MIFLRAFEGVQKTRRRVLSGIKTLGETPAHFLQSMFSLGHFTSAGTCLQMFRIVDIRVSLTQTVGLYPAASKTDVYKAFSLDDTYAQRGAFITQEALEGGVNLIIYGTISILCLW